MCASFSWEHASVLAPLGRLIIRLIVIVVYVAYFCTIMCQMMSYEWVQHSQLQGKRFRWLGHVFRMRNDRLPKKLLFGEVKGPCPPGRLGLVSIMSHCAIVKIVVSVGLIGMHKTGCSGETRLAPHIPSSS